MKNLQQLRSRWNQIAEEIKAIPSMRAGSICNQVVKRTTQEGKLRVFGPYPILTRKAKGKTLTRRLAKNEVETYDAQIRHFRHFQELVSELVETGRQIADLETAQPEAAKKTPDSDRTRTAGRSGADHGTRATRIAAGLRGHGVLRPQRHARGRSPSGRASPARGGPWAALRASALRPPSPPLPHGESGASAQEFRDHSRSGSLREVGLPLPALRGGALPGR